MQGRYDNQTSTDTGGEKALAGLSNAHYVEFPNAGHVLIVWGFLNQRFNPSAKCAFDIGVAFVNQPEIAPDSRCTEALKPEFVLPQ